MDQVNVHVEAEVWPTEDEAKVKTAFTNLFNSLTVAVEAEGNGRVLRADASGQDCLVKFRNLLRNDRIRDAARKALFRSIRGNTIGFCLNKQVAFAGHVSFCAETAESPLGPIRVTITSDSPRQLVEWVAEKT